jgi:hypothetical protein
VKERTQEITMTPEDVPGPAIAIDELFPWLALIVPAAQEPDPAEESAPEVFPEAA